MTIIEVKKLIEDDTKRRFNGLIDLDNYLDGCKTCELPGLLHKGNTCSRSNQADLEKEYKVWSEYREMMKPIVVHIKRGQKEQSWDSGIRSVIETMEKKWSQEEKVSSSVKSSGMARVVKPAKVPTWTKSMGLDVYTRQLTIWQNSNADVPESMQFQDLVKSLKIYKEVKGLERYVSEHVLTILSTPEKQKVT